MRKCDGGETPPLRICVYMTGEHKKEAMMPYNPNIHHRGSIRLKDYDYRTPGDYFVTINVQDRATIFGEIIDGVIKISEIGAIVLSILEVVPYRYTGIQIESYCLMPDHIHIVIRIIPDPMKYINQSDLTLCQVIAFFKYESARLVNEYLKQPGRRIWQRNYYEHIVRDEVDLTRIHQYMEENPLRISS